jgi:O-acetylhomoserine (thiol)-lyase
MNPTVDAFEQRVAALEDGVAAVATSSGMAAITLAILNIAGAGDEIIADSNLYGGTYNLFAHTLPKYGINVVFADGSDPEAVRSAFTPKTKAVFGEIITNPSLNVFDVEAIAAVAHEQGVPLIIDNTFATPYLTKPLTWGADIVVHSATKWIGGHGTTIGGIVVDGGRFNWNSEKFPGFTEPDESYNGLRYIDVGPAAFATKFRVQLLRDIGAALSPHSAFLLLQGLETLHLRMREHVKNAEEVAAYLEDHPAVEWVNFPGLETHPSHHIAKKYLQEGYGSIITFGIQGGREAGRKLIDNVKLWSHVANVGDAKSLIIHPASTTHQQLSVEDLKQSGVTEELVRLSVGIESVQDVLLDLDQAIAEATGSGKTIKATEADAVKWLLHSPFDRSSGTRKKVIAAVRPDQSAKQLEDLGFHVVPVGDTTDVLQGKTYSQLSDIPHEVDAFWVKEHIPATALEALVEKQVKILWLEKTHADEQTQKLAKAAGITIITNKHPHKEAEKLRATQRNQASARV